MSEDMLLEKSFTELELSQPVLKALEDLGYETPTPIQSRIIPHILEGRDVVGQAQTGTGKTAAFALPLLSHIDIKNNAVQVLVLTPTRELAIQVAEAFQGYAGRIKGFHVLPIYGGQDYQGQFRRLKRGVHVVVGTPGRVMDHMRRETLNLESLECLVLDEADEMLRMGFIEDVEWILEQTPQERQIALFSATIPNPIRRIANKFLRNPETITIKTKTTTVETTRQRYWMVSDLHKLDVLTRILEAEPFEAIIIFVRTKTATVELAEKLAARGYACAPLNGDIAQRQRERTIERLKKGQLNILIATDVAARGLDVDRISHIINYDIPNDTESYVHRIGRTGRAGRSGEAILFVAPRERRLLNTIEKATKQQIALLELPSTEMINDRRIAKFKQRITDVLAVEEFGLFYQIVEEYRKEHNVPALEIAAALAKLLQGDEPLLLKQKPVESETEIHEHYKGKQDRTKRKERSYNAEEGMQTYRIEVGKDHGAKPGDIVGAIANEAGIDGEFIGRIDIQREYSFVDLPDDMPDYIFQGLKNVRVANKQLNISIVESPAMPRDGRGKRKAKSKQKSFKKKKTDRYKRKK